MPSSQQLDINAAQFFKMRDTLSALREETAEYIKPYLSTAALGSPAELEAEECSRPESAHTVRGQAFLLVEVAADQLTAFVKTVTEPIETIAPWSCARSLVEAAALGCWLLDPTIDARSRLSRSLAFRYEGMEQQVKWTRAAGHDPSIAKARLDDVEQAANELGFSAVVDGRKRRRGAAESMPSVTEIIKTVLDEEALYRLLSAVAHGHTWAVQQFSFARAEAAEIVHSSTAVRLIPVEKAPSITGLSYLVVAAAKTFGRLAWYQSLYFGWDHNALRQILEAKFDSLGLADHVRVWRHTSSVSAE